MTGGTAAPACVPNIGARGRRRRAAGGVVWLVVGLAAVAVLHFRHAATPAYLPLVIPFTLAALGWFQAREKT